MIYNIYKYRGETPLEALQRFKGANPQLKGEKMTYLGRLDPMAEGVLLIATSEDTKKRDQFLELDKEYDFSLILGFSTDSYDVLGKILRAEIVEGLSELQLINIGRAYEGKRLQKYPPFSSRTVHGRALHEWARREELDQIDVPSKQITIHKMNYKGLQRLSSKELLGRLLMDISKVKGDFRQHETLVLWKELLANHPAQLSIAKFSAHVSSGTYIRSIVNELGNTLGCGACALSITRTRVGEFTINDSVR